LQNRLSLIDGQQSMLLSMATGTGKTRTILGLIYRFINASRFYRVLFLVDRTALGEQAQDVFKEVKLEDLMTLDEIYNIKELEDLTKRQKYISRPFKVWLKGLCITMVKQCQPSLIMI